MNFCGYSPTKSCPFKAFRLFESFAPRQHFRDEFNALLIPVKIFGPLPHTSSIPQGFQDFFEITLNFTILVFNALKPLFRNSVGIAPLDVWHIL